MKPITVLYIVGRVTPTSVPLEVAQFIKDSRVQLTVAAFYQTHYSGHQFEVNPIRIGAKGRYDLSAVYRLYQQIIRVRPDVLHVHHTVPAFWGALLGKGMLRARLVRSEHNNYNFRSTGQRLINAVSQGLADRVLCNSENTYRSMEGWRKRLLGNRWRVAYNGIDVERIDQASSAVAPPFKTSYEGVIIGSVGRLVDQKNYTRLIRAFAEVVNRSDRDARLVLVGNGSNREAIETEVRRFGLDGDVIFTGEIDRDEVYASLHAFDIFIVPSLWEGFCNAAVEAMAAGLPIVCSDIPTLHEVVGDVAVYVDPEDSKDMARGLSDLIHEGPEEWKRRGMAARGRASKHFTVERTAEKYVESYLEVADRDVSPT